MKLRFDVDQAECFRKGIDAPKSIVTIEVDPATLQDDERNLIADRLHGIDVCKLDRKENDIFKVYTNAMGQIGRFKAIVCTEPVRVIAKSPDYAGLIETVRENEDYIANFGIEEAGFIGSNAQVNPRPEWKPGRAQ